MTCKVTKGFWGIRPAPVFANDMLDAPPSYKQAKSKNLISSEFPELLWERSMRICQDLKKRSVEEGFEFYNGDLARLLDVIVTEGQSPIDQVLKVELGHTSHFTSVGTNQNLSGYQYKHFERSPENPLPVGFNWANDNWKSMLADSLLANTLAIHLILYNDEEILYVRRGKVGTYADTYNSTVNGVVEFSDHGGDSPLETTARNETQRELGIAVDPTSIKWIACGTTFERCQTFLSGVCRIKERRQEILQQAVHAPEGREIAENSSKLRPLVRHKQIFAIPRLGEVKFESLGLGTITLPIPTRFILPKRAKRVLVEKVIHREERAYQWLRKKAVGNWHPGGSFTLLLALAHLVERDLFSKVVEKIHVEHED